MKKHTDSVFLPPEAHQLEPLETILIMNLQRVGVLWSIRMFVGGHGMLMVFDIITHCLSCGWEIQLLAPTGSRCDRQYE